MCVFFKDRLTVKFFVLIIWSFREQHVIKGSIRQRIKTLLFRTDNFSPTTSSSFACSASSSGGPLKTPAKQKAVVESDAEDKTQVQPDESSPDSSDKEKEEEPAVDKDTFEKLRKLIVAQSKKDRKRKLKEAADKGGPKKKAKKGKVEGELVAQKRKSKSPKKKKGEDGIQTSAASSEGHADAIHEQTIEEINSSLLKEAPKKKKKGNDDDDDGDDDEAGGAEGDFKQLSGEQVNTVFRVYGICKDDGVHGSSVGEVSGGLKHFDVKIGLIEYVHPFCFN